MEEKKIEEETYFLSKTIRLPKLVGKGYVDVNTELALKQTPQRVYNGIRREQLRLVGEEMSKEVKFKVDEKGLVKGLEIKEVPKVKEVKI